MPPATRLRRARTPPPTPSSEFMNNLAKSKAGTCHILESLTSPGCVWGVGGRSRNLGLPGAKARGPSCSTAPPPSTLLEVLRAVPSPETLRVGSERGPFAFLGPPSGPVSLRGLRV